MPHGARGHGPQGPPVSLDGAILGATLKNLSLLPLTPFQKSYSGRLCIEREMPTEGPPVTVEKEDKRLK